MRRTSLLTALALLALPAAAQAAPAQIDPHPGAVSASGVATIEVANPNRHALSGRVTLTVARRTVASRTVRLPRRSVTEVRLRLRAGARSALRAEGTQQARVVARLRRAGGARVSTARRTVTLRMAAAAPQPAPAPAPPAPGPQPAPSTPAPAPAPAPSDGWVGRMGAEGAYDDLAFTLDGGRMTFTKAPAVPVICFETGSSASGEWASGELFDAPGPWTIGADASVDAPGVAVNPLVGSGPRTITYKVTGTAQAAGRITGTLGMIFYEARPDVFTGSMEIVNCHGSQAFEAVPAA